MSAVGYTPLTVILFFQTIQDTAIETIDDDDDEPAAKKLKVDQDKKLEDEEPSETKMEKQSMKFVSLEDSLKVDWNTEAYKKRIRRMDPAFFLLHVRIFYVLRYLAGK